MTLGETETRIILRIESVTCVPQFLKLMLYIEIYQYGFKINLVTFWDSKYKLCLNKPYYIKKPYLVQNKILYSALFQ